MSERIGVILGQIGTPASLDIPEIRRYLSEFLSDERVIDLPRWRWLPILHGIVLRKRPAAVRKHYEEIWTDDGSPLATISRAQADGLADRLGPDYQVELGLAYGTPSPAAAIDALDAAGISRLVAVPMFPQYSTTTTASVYDAVLLGALGRGKSGMPRKKYSPAVHAVPPYYDDPAYVAVLADHVQRHLASGPEPDHILVSYHGIPQSYVDEGDPYVQQCQESTRLLAEALGWPDDYYEIAYQSRFGRAEWVKPYLQPRFGELHRDGIRRPAVISPGFTTDCLETLHELAIEGRDLFAEGGGDPTQYRAVPCLNDDPAFLDYLADAVRDNSGGLVRTAVPAAAAPQQ